MQGLTVSSHFILTEAPNIHGEYLEFIITSLIHCLESSRVKQIVRGISIMQVMLDTASLQRRDFEEDFI